MIHLLKINKNLFITDVNLQIANYIKYNIFYHI